MNIFQKRSNYTKTLQIYSKYSEEYPNTIRKILTNATNNYKQIQKILKECSKNVKNTQKIAKNAPKYKKNSKNI